jgi:hypothetical protein
MQVISFQEFMKQGMTVKNKEFNFKLDAPEHPISQEEAQEMLFAILISFYLIYEY